MSGIESKFILGTVQLGLNYGINNQSGQPTMHDAMSMLQYAYDHGIRELDTAEAYGSAYEVIGQYHKENKPFKIITKFIHNTEPIYPKVQKALRYLGIDVFEGLLFHRFEQIENHTLWHELKNLKEGGLIRNVGVSIYTNDQFAHAIQHPGIDIIQLPFNLLDNYAQRGTLLKTAKKAGKVLHTRSTFLQGLFFVKPEALPIQLLPLKKELTRLQSYAEDLHISIAQLAMSYVLRIPEIDKILIGVDNLTQLKSNLALAQYTCDDEMLDLIHNIHVDTPELLNPTNWNR